MRGQATIGWRGEGFCHCCKHYTVIAVTPEGVQYGVRPARNTKI